MTGVQTCALPIYVTYKGTLSVALPGEDLIQNGASNFEIKDFDNVIFKRI